jgi:fructokinase
VPNSLTEPGIAQATLQGMARARAAGAVVSIDLNLRPALWPEHAEPRPHLWNALMEADLVKLARNELDYLAATVPGGEAVVVGRILEGQAQLLVVTDGAAAMQWHTREGSGKVPAFDVRAVGHHGGGRRVRRRRVVSSRAAGHRRREVPRFVATAAASPKRCASARRRRVGGDAPGRVRRDADARRVDRNCSGSQMPP